jgi:ketosteroid isomerase-like protein
MAQAPVIRKPLAVRDTSRRSLDERLALRAPRAAALLGKTVWNLPATSRIRQALLWRAVALGNAAFNRRDLAAVLISYAREVQFFPPKEMVESGLVRPCFLGHDGYREFFAEWLGPWGAYDNEPEEMIVVGNRLLTLGKLTGRGEGSGIAVPQEHASLMTLRDGKVIQQNEYFNHRDALQAIGLQA